MRATLVAAPPASSADDAIPDPASEAAAPAAAPDITRAAGALPAPLAASSTLANTSPRPATSHRTSRRSTIG